MTQAIHSPIRGQKRGFPQLLQRSERQDFALTEQDEYAGV